MQRLDALDVSVLEAAVLMEYLDEYVERIVVKWFTTADVHEALCEDHDRRHGRADQEGDCEGTGATRVDASDEDQTGCACRTLSS